MAVLRLTAIACAVALAALAGAPPASADPAAPPAAADPTEPPAAGGAPAAMSPAPDTPRELPRLDDRRRVALPPMVIPQDPAAPDRRPIYLGAGLIVLAAAFWWNRRRRDRFEHEDGSAAVRTRRARRPARDEDADDLHAAARGDAPGSHEAPDAHDPPERHKPP